MCETEPPWNILSGEKLPSTRTHEEQVPIKPKRRQIRKADENTEG